MALTRTETLMIADVRKLADIQGTGGLNRHPDVDIRDYLNKGRGAFHRILTRANADNHFVSSDAITTVDGTANYALAADLDSVFSVDLDADGVKRWLTSWDPNERSELTDANVDYSGVPRKYRLQGDNIVLAPTPGGVYTLTVWYLPTVGQFATGTDTMDTISRLDDFVSSYAARLVATKDKQWDLVREMRDRIVELTGEVELAGRMRDRNAPSRITDEGRADRYGRYLRRRR